MDEPDYRSAGKSGSERRATRDARWSSEAGAPVPRSSRSHRFGRGAEAM